MRTTAHHASQTAHWLISGCCCSKSVQSSLGPGASQAQQHNAIPAVYRCWRLCVSLITCSGRVVIAPLYGLHTGTASTNGLPSGRNSLCHGGACNDNQHLPSPPQKARGSCPACFTNSRMPHPPAPHTQVCRAALHSHDPNEQQASGGPVKTALRAPHKHLQEIDQKNSMAAPHPGVAASQPAGLYRLLRRHPAAAEEVWLL